MLCCLLVRVFHTVASAKIATHHGDRSSCKLLACWKEFQASKIRDLTKTLYFTFANVPLCLRNGLLDVISVTRKMKFCLHHPLKESYYLHELFSHMASFWGGSTGQNHICFYELQLWCKIWGRCPRIRPPIVEIFVNFVL